MKICGQCGLEYPDSKAQCVHCGGLLRSVDPRSPIEMGSGGSTDEHANYKQW
ncbi:MAG: hypothetical protein HY515_00570 [Candidatus Aenigmarchaeota archaeon]|nr:hypothetical protein [Candidatus Aenigmarchaeota archaeon]